MFKEQELSLAQQAAGLAIWEWRVDTNEVRWLPGSAPLFGRRPESLRTHEDVLNCIVANDRPKVAELRDKAVRLGESYRAEYRVLWPNGQVHWLRGMGRALDHPEVGKMLLGVTQDITADRKREDKLRTQARLLELAHEPILVRDQSDKITFWNAGAERLYGYSRAEAMGQVSHQLLQTGFETPLADIRRQLDAAGVWEGELVHWTKDGTKVHVHSRWLAFTTDGSWILETNFDLSHQRNLQTAKIWQEKAHLLGELAHEINNPLSIAINATHLLKGVCSDPHMEYVAMLENAISRIADYIRQSAELHRLASKTGFERSIQSKRDLTNAAT